MLSVCMSQVFHVSSNDFLLTGAQSSDFSRPASKRESYSNAAFQWQQVVLLCWIAYHAVMATLMRCLSFICRILWRMLIVKVNEGKLPKYSSF